MCQLPLDCRAIPQSLSSVPVINLRRERDTRDTEKDHGDIYLPDCFGGLEYDIVMVSKVLRELGLLS